MGIKKSFPTELISKYGLAGPRYTSYPTALQFHEGFDAEAYRRHVQNSNDDLIPRPLSLYVHLPFCKQLCYYCACNKKVTQSSKRADTYLQYLEREIKLQGELFDPDRKVIQLHFGGGTPTYHSNDQLRAVVGQLSENFLLSQAESREFSIEIDPRTVDGDRIAFLADIGFNRVSMGIQDFDPGVLTRQKIIDFCKAIDTQAILDIFPCGTPREVARKLKGFADAGMRVYKIMGYGGMAGIKFGATSEQKVRETEDELQRLTGQEI